MSFRTSARSLGATILVAVAACSEQPSVTGPIAISRKAPALAIDPAVACSGATLPIIECEALVALYNSTNGPAWVGYGGWGVNPNPCAWDGIACTDGDHGSVQSIVIRFAGLAGPLPPEIGNLSGLERLILTNNEISGTLPASIGNLANLDTLELFENQLTGAIPASFGNLTSLRIFHASHNQLSGPMPAALGNLPNIVSMSLGHNAISGSIPASFGNLSTLTRLLLESNDLSGAIPEALGNLANLETLVLNRNELTGSIPSSFANLDALDDLSLGDNDLSGPVPDVLMQMASLKTVHLWENEFSGVLPVELAVYLEGLLWCQLETGNPGLIIPDAQPYRDADQDGDGKICFKPMTPAEDIGEDAIDEIEELVPSVLNEGQANALQSKIDNAMEKAEKGQFAAAINQMESFLTQLADMVANGTLTPAQAALFIDQAQALIVIWTAEL